MKADVATEDVNKASASPSNDKIHDEAKELLIKHPRSLSSPSLIEKSLTVALADAKLSIDSFRNSDDIMDVLSSIVNHTPLLKTLPAHIVRSGLEQIKKLLVSSLCFPIMTVFLGIGVSGGGGSSQIDVITVCIKQALLYFYRFELAHILSHEEQLAASALAVFGDAKGGGAIASSNENEELKREADTVNVNQLRVELVVSLLHARRSAILPIEITLEENYASVVGNLCCHVLGVRALNVDVIEAVDSNLLVVKQRIATSTSSNGKSRKSPVTLTWEEVVRDSCAHLFLWVIKNKLDLSRSCRNVEVLHCVDHSVRTWMKTEEYSSPAAIIRIFHSSYKQALSNVVVPWAAATQKDVNQAVKDLRRECSVLNGVVYTGDDIQPAISRELGKVMVFVFDLPMDIWAQTHWGVDGVHVGVGIEAEKSATAVCIETYSLLLNYVLIAASRTIASGDAFFIVEDLYGGDDLVLCSSAAPRISGGAVSPAESPPVSISITITTSGIVVQVSEFFMLLSESAIANEASAAKRRPLVKFKCITSTHIRLSSMQPAPSPQFNPMAEDSTSASVSGVGLALHQLLVSATEDVITKKISIEPFL